MSIFNRHVRPPYTPFAGNAPLPVRHDDWYAARAVCERLGLDVNIDHIETLTVADFVRLAFSLGERSAESRLSSRDVADGIATAIQQPELVLEREGGETDHMWKVRAVQQVVAFGVPR